MDLCEPESNGSKRKHHFHNDEVPASKVQRPSSPSTPRLSPKITDLDFNCLEKIFMRLDLPSLFSLAAANAYLRSTAQYIYKRKFGPRMVCLTAVEDCTPNWCSKLSVTDDIVAIFGLKPSLEYLRSLGASIGCLLVMYRNTDSKWSECIDLYLKNYCAESLSTLVLVEKSSSSIPWNFVELPFVNVRSFVILNSDLTNQLGSLPAWFPNLQVLELRNVRMYDRFIERPFQHLTRLFIDVNNGTRPSGFTKREAAHLLRLCPAVVSLEIRMPVGRHGMTLKTLANVIQNNQSIRQLRVSMEKYWSCVKPTEVEQFVREHPHVSSISFENFKFTAETATAMLRQLNSLTVFTFQIKDDEELYAFVGQLAEQWKCGWGLLDLSGRRIVEAIKQQ